MLTIEVPSREFYDERSNKFFTLKGRTIQLEHSLVSLSKWEAKWKKPFLSEKQMTKEQFIDYVRCMTITQNVDPLVYNCITDANIAAISQYINDPMTATTFSEEHKGGGRREVITAELIYYWMIALNIPIECQKWHLNRLLTLVRVCNIKNQPPKKMSKKDVMRRNKALNAARKKKLNTHG